MYREIDEAYKDKPDRSDEIYEARRERSRAMTTDELSKYPKSPVCPLRYDHDCDECSLANNGACETGTNYLHEVECKKSGNTQCSECGSFDTGTVEKDTWQGDLGHGGNIAEAVKVICNQCGAEENL